MLGLGLEYLSSSDDSDRERKVSSSSPSATEKAPVEKPAPGLKRIRKLPSLPSTFDSASAAHNNPSAHQGRVRSRPFADGDYYAHVYVELDVSAPLRRTIDATLAEASSTCEVHALVPTDGKLHVSLSHPLPLRRDAVKSFPSTLSRTLSGAGAFSLSLAGAPVVYYNTLGGPTQAAGRGKPTPGARAFLGLRVGAGARELADLLGKQEGVLAKMHLPLYHAQPEFHASFGWALCPSPQEGGDINPEATPFPVGLVARLAQHTDPVLAEHPGWHVGALCVKVAKDVTRIQL
ncbi:hypothetical protein CcaverHIS002_0212270 [Cutaneotrichosporon cavernicola]|uniref:U6 snRNA phosphodiesterase 1 n=1 Tax=Cutaneotrichosporon cavernicola TaxID=279322 RepID=A0AA48IEN4_9TREE|nr:uncharacterized protein CcaverHIS019_0212280 [Cutaneotrichosporon cavernicola]BEI82067.1 hypothetical protein CcaverHIS002_0212270 [Cutaneotrichosporon cavernicola]BEI89866.1 hypothetical protein CcaverHIS019_0212280 [Cutaneotrichosporon cavernicola]BEI97636.1 hypothetical protein CcaverHIS631_0212250 [Cutaneotrichosporon cavernicola]BEJ05414.1 hypothetical protein CcaverHIS641_0212310 [Cutaneotrichosporon cavernicola]